jgi:membrane fusion protein, peptide pheromone/bacteriocin exporter
MKKQIKNIQEIKDSRILFDKNPPAFGYLFIAIVGVFILLAIIFAIKTPKVYTIKTNGTVTNSESNYVMSSYTGEIDECYLKEGALVERGDVLFTVKSTDYDVQHQQLVANREIYEEQIQKYDVLIKSIKDNTNYFEAGKAEDELYSSTYEKYKAQIEQNRVDVSTYKAYGYSDDQIETELVKNESKVMEVYYSAIQAAENAKSEANIQIATINSQMSAIESGQGAYAVRATSTGVLHLVQDYKSGMVVQTTTTVATITPENSEKIILAYVSTADMARMKIGNNVQIAVDGLAQNVYGTVNGTVVSIDSNVTVQQGEDGISYQMFKVIVELDEDYLLSRSGEEIKIQNGMTAEARIQYNKVSYLSYALEKLGVKVR